MAIVPSNHVPLTQLLSGGGLVISGWTLTKVKAALVEHQHHTSKNPPICTCTDVTAANACRVQVTNTNLTISGTGGHTVDYICIGRN
jgi:hypothetical protein